jgi:putative ATP-dependent endonuclease of OLD family
MQVQKYRVAENSTEPQQQNDEGSEPAQLRRLEITNFRGLKHVIWHPKPGVNLILGGGDVGKTTLLEAIALLLHPTSSFALNDADYWLRDTDNDFVIEAVIAIPQEYKVQDLSTMPYPWAWNGSDAVPKPEDDESPEAVYRIRARGTVDMDLTYEMVQPQGDVITFPAALRKRLGLVKLSSEDRNDKDLRLVQGAALDRLLADKTLRARLGSAVSDLNLKEKLTKESSSSLDALNALFTSNALPKGLSLGFLSSPGQSIGSLVGLTALKQDESLPLTSWGAGTRRLAALTIASATQGGKPITVVDEIERGLEPYRQRRLLAQLSATKAQVFLTTHSSAVLSAARETAIWYFGSTGKINLLNSKKIAPLLSRDPECLLSRLPVIVEGATEVGFLEHLFDLFVPQWKERGVSLTDGKNNEQTLEALEALSNGGQRCAGMADREPVHTLDGRWGGVKTSMADLLLRWDKGCLEENVLPLLMKKPWLEILAEPTGRMQGTRLRTLAIRLGIDDKSPAAIEAAAGGGLLALIVEAATGSIPERLVGTEESQQYKAHSRAWFKSAAGGYELAGKLLQLPDWKTLAPTVWEFVEALQRASELDPA